MNTEEQGIEPAKENDVPFSQHEIIESEHELLHTDPQKALMLGKLIKYMGIVSYAANEAGISRRTHYNWLKADNAYKEAVTLICELAIDFSEVRLFKQVNDGNLHAVMFVLRTKGKNRGYSVYQQKQVEQDPVINIVVKDQETADLIKKAMGRQ